MSSIEAIKYDLTIKRFRTFSKTFTFLNPDKTAMDLTGHTFLAECRKEKDYESALIFAFNVDVSDIANGNVTIYLSIAETGAISPITGQWDLLVDNGTISESWIEGIVEVEQSITNQP